MQALTLPQPPTAAIAALLGETPFGMAALAGGGNNRVFRIEAGGRALVLKQYFHHPDDPRDRLGAEFGFASFAWRNGVRCLPEPVAADAGRHLGLYAFVPGRKLEENEVDEKAVAQALDFVVALDALRGRADSARLPAASEACFRFADHLAVVERRVRRLGRIELHDSLQAEAALFVSQVLVPAWDKLAAYVRDAAARAGIVLDEELPQAERTISPSDFGFHNALRDEAGTIRFIDFEYAGWDDPAKLVGDFFNQVAVPVPRPFYDTFAERIAASRPRPELQRKRFGLLLPVYAMKWACIILNDFLPAGEMRRRFAGASDTTRREQQLLKARKAIAALSL
jgi:Phosphotransferase enzyme family